jgi:hypothetical protein
MRCVVSELFSTLSSESSRFRYCSLPTFRGLRQFSFGSASLMQHCLFSWHAQGGRFRRLTGTMSPPDDSDTAEIYVEVSAEEDFKIFLTFPQRKSKTSHFIHHSIALPLLHFGLRVMSGPSGKTKTSRWFHSMVSKGRRRFEPGGKGCWNYRGGSNWVVWWLLRQDSLRAVYGS